MYDDRILYVFDLIRVCICLHYFLFDLLGRFNVTAIAKWVLTVQLIVFHPSVNLNQF